MNNYLQATGKFDILGDEIFLNDTVELILIDDAIDFGVIGIDTLHVITTDTGELSALDCFGELIRIDDWSNVKRVDNSKIYN
ncbi:hypothetical protein [Rubrolithibacter danxiaensis]|uniref:hypothetical protein n=1 Tax=Rubrolithibacter danxiaensis TaxID=3390805 RepID=UPI003BF8DAAA